MTPAPTFSEDRRQILHMAMGGFALLLRDLPWWIAAIMAGCAVAFNAYVLPRAGGRRVFRPSDVARGFPAGILFYPISVLLLILVFPNRPDIAAAAWGIMAFGDGAPSLPRRSRARDDTHRITRALTVAAADRFLKNKPEAAAAMNEAYARTLLGRVVSDLEWLEK